MSSSCIASSRMIWFEMKRWICREGRNRAHFNFEIQRRKWERQRGLFLFGFCVAHLWSWCFSKKSGLNWILYLFFCKNDFTIKIKLLNVIVIHLSICACVCLCVWLERKIFVFLSTHFTNRRFCEVCGLCVVMSRMSIKMFWALIFTECE